MGSNKQTSVKQPEIIHSYYTDLDVNDQLYAVIIRSPVSTGTIRSISHPDLPKNFKIITSRDIPGRNSITVLDTSFPVLAYEKISYKGEPIGLLCGNDTAVLKKTVSELEIKYTEAQTADDDNDDSPITGNQILKHSVITRGDPSTVYYKSPLQLEKTYTSSCKTKSYEELLGCLAIPDKNSISLFLPAQWSCHVRKTVSVAAGIPEESIHIKKTIIIGSSHSNLWSAGMTAAQAAVAAIIMKKPVKLVLSRKEMEQYVENPVNFTTRFQAALEKDGRVQALTAMVIVDAGAFAPFSDDIINRILVSSFGPYQFSQFQIEVFIKKSFKPPLSTDITIADAHPLMAVELFMQEVSRTLNLMPNDVRKINCKAGPFSPISVNGDEHDSTAGFPELHTDKMINVLDSAVQRSDYLRRYVSYSLTSQSKPSFFKHAPVRGIGIATGYQGSGFLSSKLIQNSVSLEVTMKMDESVTIHAITPSKNIQRIWKNQAAKILSIHEDTIHLDPESGSLCDDEIPETMSSKISTVTALVKKCSTAIQKMRFRQPLPIKVKRTIQISKPGTWNLDTLEGKPFYSVAWVCAVIEVEINTYTYELSVHSVRVVIDAGEILQPKEAELSIKKAVEHILSNAMNGSILSSAQIEVSFIESTEDSKEIGNCMDMVVPAALLNAVSVALNKPVTSYPLEPETIFTILTARD